MYTLGGIWFLVCCQFTLGMGTDMGIFLVFVLFKIGIIGGITALVVLGVTALFKTITK